MTKQKIPGSAVILIIALIFLGIFLFQKPGITGKVIQGKETIFSESLNLQVNESGDYEWNVKNPGSIRSLKATGSVTSNGTAKVYIEKNGSKYLLFDSTKQLFDIGIHVLPEYKSIFQGEEILIQIELTNLRGFGSGNVNVKYSIKDAKENLVASEEETIFIETQAKFVRKLLIPAEIKPGTYAAFVEVSTDVIAGTGSDTFEVKSRYKYSPELKYYLIGVAVVAALAIAFILSTYGLRALKKKQKIAELKEKVPEEKAKKLEKELKALETAYKAGFISKESYEKDKKRIKEKIK
ncbi:hypothetical protein HYX04_00250 [Candidatus Woesearchaeota archaeon]|nr:hypothetical protein [Candidatus Woesearchaeota archaeon]